MAEPVSSGDLEARRERLTRALIRVAEEDGSEAALAWAEHCARSVARSGQHEDQARLLAVLGLLLQAAEQEGDQQRRRTYEAEALTLLDTLADASGEQGMTAELGLARLAAICGPAALSAARNGA